MSQSDLKSPSFLSKNVTVAQLNNLCNNTLVSHLGIEFSEIGDNYLCATMPVNANTHQPLGLLHGGASVALAETLGSVAASLCVNHETQYCVGLEINANHIKSVREGQVIGRVQPIHIGKKTQVWEIKISNTQSELICISRITMAVIDKR